METYTESSTKLHPRTDGVNWKKRRWPMLRLRLRKSERESLNSEFYQILS